MLEDLRSDIDLIDSKISGLFEQRLNIVLKIAKIKRDQNMDIYDNLREILILKKVKENVNDFNKPYVEELYKKIFKICKEYQEDECYKK